MSISGERRTALRYLLVSALCAVFALVYELFSHGVLSWYMALLPLWPLLGGALPFGVMARLHVRPAQLTRCLWHAGLTALTMGSLMTGVFEIYGSMSSLVRVYWTAGACLMAAGLADFVWCRFRGRNTK